MMETHCFPWGSFSCNFSSTFTSSLAASLYLSTFLMIFNARTWSLRERKLGTVFAFFWSHFCTGFVFVLIQMLWLWPFKYDVMNKDEEDDWELTCSTPWLWRPFRRCPPPVWRGSYLQRESSSSWELFSGQLGELKRELEFRASLLHSPPRGGEVHYLAT